ncbi:nucleotidyltransferase domain-containing protein [Natroniella sulfidigena]|uniref:type VII toxin-antitoxin system MntA family adenylyltransferase antitoxin n=1 Tax=Natroniella sulfidigena TaxID=723921 RepID=UPI00200B3755|nr:nucleotidyltransferase domain-containing protein [Natroniella sulfidigena]MCK8817145.1 nucleotidyltransferase domain-containing protein [Natroniella sulfidigena]
MLDKDRVVEIIRKYCSQNQDIVAVYLFGSLARGTFNQNSDVDIALMLNPNLDKLEAFDLKLEIALDLEKSLGVEVDVVIFSNADLRLKHQIIKGDLIIGKNNKLRVREESKAVTQYLDMRYFYDQYEEQAGKEFTHG